MALFIYFVLFFLVPYMQCVMHIVGAVALHVWSKKHLTKISNIHILVSPFYIIQTCHFLKEGVNFVYLYCRSKIFSFNFYNQETISLSGWKYSVIAASSTGTVQCFPFTWMMFMIMLWMQLEYMYVHWQSNVFISLLQNRFMVKCFWCKFQWCQYYSLI